MDDVSIIYRQLFPCRIITEIIYYDRQTDGWGDEESQSIFYGRPRCEKLNLEGQSRAVLAY